MKIHLFNINIDEIIENFLPPIFKRKEGNSNNIFQLLHSLLVGVKSLRENETIPYRDESYFILGHNSQVMSLEHYLNIEYNLAFPIDYSQSIYITNGVLNNRMYLYENEKFEEVVNDEPVYFFDKSHTDTDTVAVFRIYNDNESQNNGFYDKDSNKGTYNQDNTNVRIDRIQGIWQYNTNGEYGYAKDPSFVKQWFDSNDNPVLTVSLTKWYLNTADNYQYLNDHSYIVHVPTSIWTATTEDHIKAVIDRYNTAGFTYTIVWY